MQLLGASSSWRGLAGCERLQVKGLSPQLQIGSNASTAISCPVSQQLSLTITAALSSRLMCCGWHQHLPAVYACRMQLFNKTLPLLQAAHSWSSSL